MSNGEDGPSLAQQAAQQAKGLMGKIAAPIKELEKERARDKKLDELKAGAMMQLLPDGKQRQSLTVKVAVSPDGAMVTWEDPSPVSIANIVPVPFSGPSPVDATCYRHSAFGRIQAEVIRFPLPTCPTSRRSRP